MTVKDTHQKTLDWIASQQKPMATLLKEWSDWSMKDWIKAGIVAVVVIIVLQSMMGA